MPTSLREYVLSLHKIEAPLIYTAFEIYGMLITTVLLPLHYLFIFCREESYGTKFARDALFTGYLRLTNNNIETLEKACEERGIDIESHPHLNDRQIQDRMSKVFQ